MSTYICNIGVSRRFHFHCTWVALHISSFLTGFCIDGAVAGCRRVGLACGLEIHTLLMALVESGIWIMDG